jgi:glycosidase
MARDTNKALRNKVIYCVYVRSHSAAGTFKAVEADLDRIKSLGADIIWFLPIHPIGEKNRKGALGSPYAIRDYRRINPEFGTSEDFASLVTSIRSKGMLCMVDVVYNHTSPDSWLAQNHPEWFHHTPEGRFGNKTGDWADVIDLDYNNPGLWDYQIETLKMWAKVVDGFRCDVAPLVPLEFWLCARAEVEKIHPGFIWLSESVDPGFTFHNRSLGFVSLSDSEIFQAFDICYDYDIHSYFHGYLEGKNTLSEYADRINHQEVTYPENYVKLRFIENHDNMRAKFVIPDVLQLRNWTAFLYFQKGATLIYAGQETGKTKRPDLFNRDEIKWDTGFDISQFMSILHSIKKNRIFTDSSYKVTALPNEILLAAHKSRFGQMIGAFSVKGNTSLISVPAPDGIYKNLIDGEEIDVEAGKLSHKGAPIIFEIPAR